MSARRLLCMLAVVAAVGPAAAPADDHTAPAAGGGVVAAVIDTGIHPSHQEFDYRGPASTEDQFVGWWDFTDNSALPAAGQTWDHRNPTPSDGYGHGTATASLVAGLNAAHPAAKSPSFAPGAKLAIAKVCGDDGGCTGTIAPAIRWAVDSVSADVISISIGSIVPFPDALSDVNEAADYARRSGVLVVVSNGNGIGGTGLVPSPGFASLNADSPYVLSVGSSEFIWQAGFSTDPEVVAKALGVPSASNECDACYEAVSGTSFAAPLVAGMGVSALQEAARAGRDIDPAALEILLKSCARDSFVPPNWEGYGIMDAAQIDCVRTHAFAGTTPARPDPDLNALYTDGAILTLRKTWADTLDRGVMTFQPLPVPGPTNGPGRGGFGVVAGVVEADRFAIDLSAGETASAGFTFAEGDGGVEVLAFRGAGPAFSGVDLIARSGWVYGESGGVTFRVPEAGSYTFLVVTWSNILPEQFGLEEYDLQVSSTDPATPNESWVGESYYATTTTYLG